MRLFSAPMPQEEDQERLDLLWRLVAHNRVTIHAEAVWGEKGDALNVGLAGLWPAKQFQEAELKRRLLMVLQRHLEAHGKVTRIDQPGSEVHGDPRTLYEFRTDCRSPQLERLWRRFSNKNVYIETVLELDDPKCPWLIVRKVKLKD